MKDLIEGEEVEVAQTPGLGASAAAPSENHPAASEVGDAISGYKPLKFKDPMELNFIAPMPFSMSSTSVPNFMELRQSWRLGI